MRLCKLGIHEWTEWYESTLSKYRWFREEVLHRDCRRCGKRERINFNKHDLQILLGVDNSHLQSFQKGNTIANMNNEWEKLKEKTAKRNKLIYDEYMVGDISMNKIAIKYKLSRERIRKIVHSMEEKLSTATTIDKKRERVYTGRG